MKKLTIAIASCLYLIIGGCATLKQKEVSPVTVTSLPVDSFTIQKLQYREDFEEAPASRQYVFRNTAFFRDSLIISFDLNDGGASSIRSGKFSKTLRDAFYTRKMSEDISKEYAGSRYERDSLDLFSDMDKINLENIYAIAQGDKSYLLFFFHKHNWSIGPYTNFYYLLFDCSTPDKINCIMFRSLDMPDGAYSSRNGLPLDISVKGGVIHFIANYYKTIRTATTEWETGSFTISQDRSDKWLLKGN